MHATFLLLSLAAIMALGGDAAAAASATTTQSSSNSLRGGGNVQHHVDDFLLGKHTGRPAHVILPDDYHKAEKEAWPLVMVLHGYGSNGAAHDFYMGVSRESPAMGGFITIQANGTWDPKSNARFWNGKACCDHNEMNPNDKKYLVDLVNEAKSKYKVDSNKVYAFGHSNGGLMAQILVCQESKTFRGMVGLSPNVIPGKCWETTATRVLLISGTADLYLAPCVNADNIQRWGGYLGCASEPSLEEQRDLDCEENAPSDYDSYYDKYKDHNCALPGAETEVKEWRGCGAEGDKKMALWTMKGSSHSPSLSSTWTRDALRFLLED